MNCVCLQPQFFHQGGTGGTVPVVDLKGHAAIPDGLNEFNMEDGCSAYTNHLSLLWLGTSEWVSSD
ncbi:MAG TPA: hypothetical protein DD706_22870 [Nitrospiraceae bacterium]|nr:hypothetical protein [Nitrospiraceae bacterium]